MGVGFLIFVVIFYVYLILTRFFFWLWEMLMRLIDRRTEYRADSFSASLGVGAGLASALERLVSMEYTQKGIAARLMSSHPNSMTRVGRLEQLIAK